MRWEKRLDYALLGDFSESQGKVTRRRIKRLET
jgi:hypothetical protein